MASIFLPCCSNYCLEQVQFSPVVIMILDQRGFLFECYNGFCIFVCLSFLSSFFTCSLLTIMKIARKIWFKSTMTPLIMLIALFCVVSPFSSGSVSFTVLYYEWNTHKWQSKVQLFWLSPVCIHALAGLVYFAYLFSHSRSKLPFATLLLLSCFPIFDRILACIHLSTQQLLYSLQIYIPLILCNFFLLVVVKVPFFFLFDFLMRIWMKKINK